MGERGDVASCTARAALAILTSPSIRPAGAPSEKPPDDSGDLSYSGGGCRRDASHAKS